MGRLVDRRPSASADELAAGFTPPKRFSDVRFETFVPDPGHPSQAAAKAALATFAATLGPSAPTGGRWGRRSSPPPRREGNPGRYLDGGFGVGKTHLLASL